MGKTSKPTRILISPKLQEWPEIESLRSQGHIIDVLHDMEYYDLVLGESCWNMDELLRPYLLSLALPAARKRAEERKKISDKEREA